MADATETANIEVTVPAMNLDQMIAQKVLDSKLEKLIETELAKVFNQRSGTYSLNGFVEEIIKQEIRSVVQQTLSMPFNDEHDDRNPGAGDPNHPARKLKAAIVAEVDRQLTEPEALDKLVKSVLGRGY